MVRHCTKISNGDRVAAKIEFCKPDPIRNHDRIV